LSLGEAKRQREFITLIKRAVTATTRGPVRHRLCERTLARRFRKFAEGLSQGLKEESGFVENENVKIE
jgi:hypothetical protein